MKTNTYLKKYNRSFQQLVEEGQDQDYIDDQIDENGEIIR